VDDFGLDAAVDGSVFALAAAGRISATGALVDAPRWRADGPRLAQELGARIDIGLHLNLSESFADRPAPYAWGEAVLKAYAGLLDRAAVRAEIERQLAAFERVAGRTPDFIDGHRHVHQLPVVREALLQALRARGITPWIRCTLPRSGQGFKAAVIGALGARSLSALARGQGLPQNHRMLGVYGFDADAAVHRARLQRWLSLARDRDLLMCHTALPLAQGEADPIGAARRVEHALLAGEDFAAAIAAQGITITRLSTRA
jgi:predicted glycoside hydrolase/deacetylase ChbG (UPF0249 family)